LLTSNHDVKWSWCEQTYATYTLDPEFPVLETNLSVLIPKPPSEVNKTWDAESEISYRQHILEKIE
jgi:hypothetical protein